ncbi:triacylglycerol lipase 2-like [Elaeis guineensis]|uniref:Lipase n=1 Tax=Elaeis guineensis var. tenera TaxID=51953 RepID=A0A6J0PCH9_ELAGV|nr:triacylglycerol lipase 2-like [Elaeis guineensis]
MAEIHIMANNLCSSLPWVLFFVFMIDAALGVRKDSSSCDGPSGSGSLALAQAPTSTDKGTCKSRVEIYGYECEEHHVATKDGYILSIQRIPNGRSATTQRARKKPVLLQHGVFMDGITWLLNSPHESLGYILADKGYDVWISNSRGTKYSLQHATLSPEDPAYWEWSWDELVAFDLPATFEYVYRHTGHQKLHYVGHSLGTLMALASFCEHHLLHMVRSAALISPIAYMNQVRSPIARGVAEAFTAEIYYRLGIYEFNPLGEAARKLLSEICRIPDVNCYDIITSFTGENCCLDTSSIEIFLRHEPQPTATKNIIHLSQMIRRGTITKYDYGNSYENKKHYGQVVPPAYNLSSVPNDLPLFLTYGGRDYLSVVGDVKHLLQRLKLHDKTKLKVEYLPNYAHADFVMAVNASQLVYDPLIAFFKLH